MKKRQTNVRCFFFYYVQKLRSRDVKTGRLMSQFSI